MSKEDYNSYCVVKRKIKRIEENIDLHKKHLEELNLLLKEYLPGYKKYNTEVATRIYHRKKKEQRESNDKK